MMYIAFAVADHVPSIRASAGRSQDDLPAERRLNPWKFTNSTR